MLLLNFHDEVRKTGKPVGKLCPDTLLPHKGFIARPIVPLGEFAECPHEFVKVVQVSSPYVLLNSLYPRLNSRRESHRVASCSKPVATGLTTNPSMKCTVVLSIGVSPVFLLREVPIG